MSYSDMEVLELVARSVAAMSNSEKVVAPSPVASAEQAFFAALRGFFEAAATRHIEDAFLAAQRACGFARFREAHSTGEMQEFWGMLEAYMYERVKKYGRQLPQPPADPQDD